MASVDEERYLRLCLLINKVATPIFRDVFDQTIQQINPPVTFQQLLTSNYAELLKIRGKVIKPAQWHLLYPFGPTSGIASIVNFDLTLLMILIRNMKNAGSNIFSTPATTWDKPPSVTDTSTEADLLRIKQWRNDIAHRSTANMTEIEFNTTVSEMNNTFTRLKNTHTMPCDYTETINQVLHESIDSNDANQILQMLKVEEDVKTLILTEVQGLHEKIVHTVEANTENVKTTLNTTADCMVESLQHFTDETNKTLLKTAQDTVCTISKKCEVIHKNMDDKIERKIETVCKVVHDGTKSLHEANKTVTEVMERHAEDSRTENKGIRSHIEEVRSDIEEVRSDIEEVRCGLQELGGDIKQTILERTAQPASGESSQTDKLQSNQPEWKQDVDYVIKDISPRLLKNADHIKASLQHKYKQMYNSLKLLPWQGNKESMKMKMFQSLILRQDEDNSLPIESGRYRRENIHQHEGIDSPLSHHASKIKIKSCKDLINNMFKQTNKENEDISKKKKVPTATLR